MSKSHTSISSAQLERRQAHKARRQRWDQFWGYFVLAILLGIIFLNIVIVISHHI